MLSRNLDFDPSALAIELSYLGYYNWAIFEISIKVLGT